MNKSTLIKSTILLTLLLTIFSQMAVADTPVWKFPNAKWYSMMETGNLIVGNDGGLTMVDGSSGQPLWQRADLKGVKEGEITELTGTPFLIIADNSGYFRTKTKMLAVDTLTGKTIWETDKIVGFTANVSVDYEKDIIIFLTILSNKINRDKPDIYAVKLSTGEFLWHSEYTEKVDLYGKVKKSSWFSGGSGGGGLLGGGLLGNKNNNSSDTFDLHGENPPVFDGDSVYLTYAGLHRFNLADGKLVWGQKYDVTDGAMNNTNGKAIIDGDTIYTSANSMIRAINKNDGSVKWKTKDYGKGGIAQTIMVDNTIYCRMGGTFFDSKKGRYVTKGPIGVVAVNKADGAEDWYYKKASILLGDEDTITNMIVVPEDHTLLVAGDKTLIALDTTVHGKTKEAYKIPLKFKNKIGFFSSGTKNDPPVNLSRVENGLVIVEGMHHLTGFDTKTQSIVWSNAFAVVKTGFWEGLAMSMIGDFSSKRDHDSETKHSQEGWYSNYGSDSKLKPFFDAYQGYMTKRMQEVKFGGTMEYIMTNLQGKNIDGKDVKGAGVVGVNLQTGKAINQIIFKDKDPDYEIDQVTGRLFDRDKDTISAFNITQTAEQVANDNEDN